MTTHSELNHLNRLENGDIAAISDCVVDEVFNYAHSNGLKHGLQIVRCCTKEDFSCGDEFMFVEIKDSDALREFTANMDYTEEVVSEEVKESIVFFVIGEEVELTPARRGSTDRKANSQARRQYRRFRRELLYSLEEAFYDGSWDSYKHFI